MEAKHNGAVAVNKRDGRPIEALAAAMIQHSEALPELAQAPLDYTIESLAALLRERWGRPNARPASPRRARRAS
jgi:hypothetical protein